VLLARLVVARDAFLRINGYYLDIEIEEAHSFITNSMACGVFNIELISAIVRTGQRA
jgi:prophage maintenance system killer protein